MHPHQRAGWITALGLFLGRTGLIVLALLSTACMEQYNPRWFWAKIAKERKIANSPTPKLTPDGKLPAPAVVDAPGAEASFKAERVYQNNCVACHGTDGAGIAALHSRNFTDPEWQALATDEQIAAAILWGAMDAPNHEPSLKTRTKFVLSQPTMISWKHLFEPAKEKEQVNELVSYIRHFKK